MNLDTSISETKPDNSGAKSKSEITCKSQDRGKQAGAELCQAQVKLEVVVEV